MAKISSMMESKRYLLDGDPVSARDLIEHAKMLDPEYGKDGWFMTSGAAELLRREGHTVLMGPERKDGGDE